MKDEPLNTSAGFSDEKSSEFLVRWRGRQEGPYTAAIMEAKLAANQIGLLHEVLHNGHGSPCAIILQSATPPCARSARPARSRNVGHAKKPHVQAKEREEQRSAELLAEERRRNDLLQAGITERQTQRVIQAGPAAPSETSPRRNNPYPCNYWLAGLRPALHRRLDYGRQRPSPGGAGIMDNSGRSSTSTGKSLGIIGTVLWIIAVIVIFSI